MCKILITGASGFLGRNLIDFFIRETEHKIVSMSRSNVSPFFVSDRVKTISYDLKKPINKKVATEIGKIDYIIHLAALTQAKESVNRPIDYVMNNIVGTANLLEFARHNAKDLRQFLYFSTAEIFGHSLPGVVLKEDQFPDPRSPYAATKLAAQELCMSYMNTYGLPIIITYAMNVFGPYQSEEKFIPLLNKKISKEEKVLIYLNAEKSGPKKRNYLYVEDLCNAIHFLNNHGVPGEKYNIASTEESDNLKIAQLISKLLGKKSI